MAYDVYLELEDESVEIDDFMEMMDRELSKTNVGKSFERLQNDKRGQPSQVELCCHNQLSFIWWN